MYPITVINDPHNIADRETHHLAAGETLADWLLRVYGPDGFSVPTAVYIGTPGDVAPLDLADFEAVNQAPTAPVYVVHSPLGIDPITLAIYVAIAVVAAVAVSLLMPVPDLSGAGRQQRRSPNNALSGQTNVARLLDRIPDPFGQVDSYPDLIAPTVTEYINHIKYQREYVCIGRGYYLLEDWKSGETLIADIAGSSVDVFEPGSQPTEILKTRQSNEVSGQLFVGPNEKATVTLNGSDNIAYLAGGSDTATITGADFTTFDGGDTVDITDLWANDGGTDYNLSGTYTVATGGTGTTLTLENVTAENANWSNFTSTPTPVLTSEGGNPLEPLVEVPGQNPVIGPFTVPGGTRNVEVWLDLTAPKGLAQGDKLNKDRTVSLRFTFEAVDSDGVPTGASFLYPLTLTDNNRDSRYWTFKVGEADGLVVGQRYRVKGERLTDTDPTTITIVDDINWQRLAGIQDITAPDDTGTTRALIETRATSQVAALQERQFNVRATRRVVTWDGSAVVGNIATGDGLTPSRRMADAFLHYMLDPDLGARAVGNVDVATLYAVQDKLDGVFGGVKGEFSYTFDNRDTPALEELRLIVQAARCFMFREGSQFSVTRDEAQPVARGLVNRRNKLPDSETRTVRFNRPLDNDGVQVEYSDIEDGLARVITLPDDLPPDDEHAGAPAAVNPLKIDGVGIRQYVQAYDRAQYEYRRLIYNRVSVESNTSMDGLLFPLNARIQHVDGTRLRTLESDGEVLRVDGRKVYTSQRCEFQPDVGYTVTLRSEEGEPIAPIPVTALPGGGCGFVLSRDPGVDIVTRGVKGYQRGTLYSFGPDGNELAEAYLLQRKVPGPDGNVALEMINYATEYFAADDREPPAKGDI